MSVRKGSIDSYHVSNNGEHATICIGEWKRDRGDGEICHCGEILIHSSFGAFANTWTACGSPFKQFLTKVEFHYFMGKCLGANFMKYDGDATLNRFLKDIVSARREQRVGKDEAREAWDLFYGIQESFQQSSDIMCIEVGGIQSHLPTRLRHIADEPWEHIEKKPDVQATWFWKEIWPEFVAALKEELVELVPA